MFIKDMKNKISANRKVKIKGGRVAPENVDLLFHHEGEDYIFPLLDIQEFGWPSVDEDGEEMAEVTAVIVKD